MNAYEIATKADIENLLCEIKTLQELLSSTSPNQRKFLRSADVRKLLNISDGTLQRLRISNSLPAQKVNGTWFYKYEDVVKMINCSK